MKLKVTSFLQGFQHIPEKGCVVFLIFLTLSFTAGGYLLYRMLS